MSSWSVTTCGGGWMASHRRALRGGTRRRHGEVTRVELSSALIDSDGEAACCSRPWRCCRKPRRHPIGSARPRAVATLDAMGESVITVDAGGRIDYNQHGRRVTAGSASRPGRRQVVSGGRFPGGRGGPAFLGRSGPHGADRRRPGEHGRRAVLVPANGAPNGPSNSASRR